MDTLNDIISGLKWGGGLDPVEAHDRILRLFNDSKCLGCDEVKELTHCEDCGNDIGMVDN